jgi:uncharacterized protein YutE (UPF0331/DUF86 family)/predicted nucleotidyltransferase
MVQYDVVEKIRRVLEEYPEVMAAYLYGSYSTGKQTPLSDVDLAVYTRDRRSLLDITAEISHELGIPEEKVSVVELSLLDPVLILRIVRHGVEVLNRGLEISLILPDASELVEVYELEEATSETWLERDPLDPRIIREIIARMREDMQDLKELQAFQYEDVVGDKHLRKSFERTVHTLIESMLDLLRHIVAGLNLGTPSYYRDYVDYVEKAGIISRDTAGQVRELIPIRHVLVHRYRDARFEELWAMSMKLSIVAEKLLSEVILNLREKHRVDSI